MKPRDQLPALGHYCPERGRDGEKPRSGRGPEAGIVIAAALLAYIMLYPALAVIYG